MDSILDLVGWLSYGLGVGAMLVGLLCLRRGETSGWFFVTIGLALAAMAVPCLRPIVAYSGGLAEVFVR